MSKSKLLLRTRREVCSSLIDPAKFGLKYRDRDNSEKTPLCIHRAPLGTHERFIGFLIEHYAGNFPLWLAPEQVRVLTLNADDNLIAYAKDIAQQLRAAEVRVTSDLGPEPILAQLKSEEGDEKCEPISSFSQPPVTHRIIGAVVEKRARHIRQVRPA